MSACKACLQAIDRLRRERDADLLRERRRTDESRRYQRDYKRRMKERLGPYANKGRLLREYGISVDQYKQMEREQGFSCGCCRTVLGEGELYVDHCHDTGVVRGLLCQKCNSGIGLLGDTPA